MPRPLLLLTAALVVPMLLCSCSRPQRTVEQVSGPAAPLDLRRGPIPPGGPSMSPTGAGAGGSAAAGVQLGRVGGQASIAVTPVQPGGFMAPVNSSGSGGGDRGNPISPDTPIVPQNSAYVTQPVYPNPQPLPPNVRVQEWR